MRHSPRRFLGRRFPGPGSTPAAGGFADAAAFVATSVVAVLAGGIAAVLAARWRRVALPMAVALTLGGCSSLTPIEKLVIAQDAEPLLAQIRDGIVDVNQPLPWGGGFGIAPSYFTPLCAAAFVGATMALDELLSLGADVNADCGASSTPLDLVMRHPSGARAAAMRQLLQARGVDFQAQPRYVQARM